MNELIQLANLITAETGDPIVDPATQQRASEMHGALVEVIASSRVRLDLQPIQHIMSGSTIGVEALARFPGTLKPAEWFRVAHALGLGNDLELRIVHEVLQRASSGIGMIAVNVSPQVITDPRLIDMLRRFGRLDLTLEVTDQTSMPELSMVRARLAEIRSLGIRVAIHVSEFGPEALRSLLIAQPDLVKLSPPLTAALAVGRVEGTQADNFFARCRHDGVFVVAVGVERHEQLVELERLGIDGYQGFLTRTVTPDPIPSW